MSPSSVVGSLTAGVSARIAKASFLVAVIVVPATLYGVIRHRKIAPPKDGLQSQPAG